jgi:hypothetical protein
MSKHAAEGCPRCGQIFICKVNSILKCDCMQVQLTQREVEYIRDLTEFDYDGSCLCVNCLLDLQAHYRSVYQAPAYHV